MTHTPRLALQVSTDRIFTCSIPAAWISAASVSVISWLMPTIGLAGQRIFDVLERDAADDAVAQGLDDFAALDDGGHVDAVQSFAVIQRK